MPSLGIVPGVNKPELSGMGVGAPSSMGITKALQRGGQEALTRLEHALGITIAVLDKV
jgi:hypothetical protein